MSALSRTITSSFQSREVMLLIVTKMSFSSQQLCLICRKCHSLLVNIPKARNLCFQSQLWCQPDNNVLTYHSIQSTRPLKSNGMVRGAINLAVPTQQRRFFLLWIKCYYSTRTLILTQMGYYCSTRKCEMQTQHKVILQQGHKRYRSIVCT